MSEIQRDHIAESIADFEAISAKEKAALLGQIMEDQPMIFGFLMNLADDFSDDEHEALIDSIMIVINAFIAAGISINTIPDELIKEVIEEKVKKYDELEKQNKSGVEVAGGISDSPKVFQDLYNRALFKTKLKDMEVADQQNFYLILDTLLTLIERMAATILQDNEEKKA